MLSHLAIGSDSGGVGPFLGCTAGNGFPYAVTGGRDIPRWREARPIVLANTATSLGALPPKDSSVASERQAFVNEGGTRSMMSVNVSCNVSLHLCPF